MSAVFVPHRSPMVMASTAEEVAELKSGKSQVVYILLFLKAENADVRIHAAKAVANAAAEGIISAFMFFIYFMLRH
ncbi:hypothetical protein PTKIN_Ptkin05aG0041500 [Pterospermum kingtungense]